MHPINRDVRQRGRSPENILLGFDEARLIRKIETLQAELELANLRLVQMWRDKMDLLDLHRGDVATCHANRLSGYVCGVVVDTNVTDLPLCETHLAEAHNDYLRFADNRPAPASVRYEERKPTAIYYIAMKDDRIKIGITSDLKRRMSHFCAQPDDLLAVEPGDYARETERHHQFVESRLAGTELFARSPELLAHITEVRSMFGDPKQFI